MMHSQDQLCCNVLYLASKDVSAPEMTVRQLHDGQPNASVTGLYRRHRSC